MSSIKLTQLLTATCLYGCLFLFPAVVFSQTKPEPSGDTQDVIKFDTSLVQTDVMVFDKNGRFVGGLRPEQFQLKIDNTPREISFFERVTSGGSTSISSSPQVLSTNLRNEIRAAKLGCCA